MSVEGGPDIVTDGLVLHLDAANNRSFVSGSTTWFDLSGNKNTGSLVNGPTFNSSNNGTVVFDGTDDYINVDIPNTDFSDATLSCWINFVNVSKNTQNFISLGDNSATIETNSNLNNFNFGWYSALKWHTNTKSGGSWATELNVNSYLPSNGLWYYVVVTYSTTGNARKIYVNGTYIGGDSNYNNPGVINFARIGGGAFTWRFQGNIPSVQIYNRALSDKQIRQNYNATKGRYGLF